MPISLKRTGIMLNAEERNITNENWTSIERAIAGVEVVSSSSDELAVEAIARAEEAYSTANSVQIQLNGVVNRETDSDAMSRQAAVNTQGFDKGNLKERLDEDYNQVSMEIADIPVNVLSMEYLQKRTAKLNPIIVAYGDSNTRYFEGDRGLGSITHSYPAWLDRFCIEHPNFYGSNVINAGFSGKTIEYGLANYETNITANNANIVVIGFGTNDIKNAGVTMEAYINNMESMINRLLADGIAPIILGIPWFEPAYAPGMEIRLPIWNNALLNLCISKNVEFVDAYNMFLTSTSVWFNEVTSPKRHYSQKALLILAKEVFSRIINLNNLAAFSKGQIKQELFNPDTINWFDSTTKVNFLGYKLGIDNMDVLQIPTGENITFKVGGRFVIAFYPREVATARFNGSLGDVTITNTIDDGSYYPIKRVSISDTSLIGTTTTITLTAIGGALYVRGIACDQIPVNYNHASIAITKEYTGANLPVTPPNGTKVYCTDLQKDVIFRTSRWFDHSGYYAVGPTSDRLAIQANIVNGYKFFDTTNGLRYRWNGIDTWTAF